MNQNENKVLTEAATFKQVPSQNFNIDSGFGHILTKFQKRESFSSSQYGTTKYKLCKIIPRKLTTSLTISCCYKVVTFI